MKQLNVYEAKTQLSALLDQVSKGASFIIAKSGKPVARLSPIQPRKRHKSKFGFMKGKIKFAPDFDAPLPDDVIKSFEGEE
ncbi:MAG TPA: type II toxin-antitoxin system Phd/YefM family antitoxin [Xanthobacteraceae bacterium]|nr:type II toxin-antitoxin system Phd/YefM family antitoxin [Xanthobacteraceae bacterium]